MPNPLQRIAALERAVRSQRPVAGEGVMVSPGLFGTVIDAAAGEASGAYDGPFAVKFGIVENVQRIVVNAGTVICGTVTLSSPLCNFPVVNGYIVGKITYDSSYHVDVLQSNSILQGFDYAVFRIAHIYERRIMQIQYGDFFVAGRVV